MSGADYKHAMRSILTFATDNNLFPGNATRYIGLAYLTAAVGGQNYPIPFNGVIQGLRVHQSVVPGGADTVTYTVMINGNATAITCIMTAGILNAADLVNTVNVAAGDLVCLRAVSSATAAPTYIMATLVIRH